MNLEINFGCNWCAFGFLAGYHNDKLIHRKMAFIQIGFFAISFEKRY